MANTPILETDRKANYPIHPLLLHRWSPRAMSGEMISDEELMSLFEAARWAPSCYNAQPWRFIYAKQNTPHWDKLFNLLIEWNKQWCLNAAVLVLILSLRVSKGKPATTHSFDTGAAWENLALEGTARQLVVHGMEGFDYEKARNTFSIPENYAVEAMIAIGKKGNKDLLREEMRIKETASNRKPLSELIFEGEFPSDVK